MRQPLPTPRPPRATGRGPRRASAAAPPPSAGRTPRSVSCSCSSSRCDPLAEPLPENDGRPAEGIEMPRAGQYHRCPQAGREPVDELPCRPPPTLLVGPKDRQRHPRYPRAERDRLRHVEARPHPAARDQLEPEATEPEQRRGRRDAPVGEQG